MKKALLCLACCLCASLAYAGNTFSISARKAAEEQKQQRQAAEQAAAIQRLVSVPCRQRLKDRKILLLIAERTGGSWNTQQDLYEPDFQLIDSRLRALGLRTFTQAEIHAQVAQAEIDAYFKGDPDAALAASKRLAASYVLRGDITTQEDVNPPAGLN